jgi:nucleoside-diphosphate kinase
MAGTQRTLAIVKPDAVKAGATGEILRRVEAAGLRILALKMTTLTEGLARGFYAVHRERPFYADLVRFMTEGPVVMAVLEGPDAIPRYRELMGATNPAKAAPGTIRADFGTARGPLAWRSPTSSTPRRSRGPSRPCRDAGPRRGRTGMAGGGSEVGAGQQEEQAQVGDGEPEAIAPEGAGQLVLLDPGVRAAGTLRFVRSQPDLSDRRAPRESAHGSSRAGS